MIRPREGFTFHLSLAWEKPWRSGTRGMAVCVSIKHTHSRLHVLPTHHVYIGKRSTIEVPCARTVSGNDPLSESWSQLKYDPHSAKHLCGLFSQSYIHYIYLLLRNKYGWEWCSTPIILSWGWIQRQEHQSLMSSSATILAWTKAGLKTTKVKSRLKMTSKNKGILISLLAPFSF